ncbi:MAG: peptidase M13 [Actinomycetota bacterium]|nr:MAG: peptidase M13 [Actinomycetota bacterium]
MTQTVTGSAAVDGGDPEVRPQDDLFGHVNGSWWRSVEIPPDLPMAGDFVWLGVQTEADIDAILREAAELSLSAPAARTSPLAAPGTPLQQVGDLYRSFLSTDHVEERGAEPLTDLLAAAAAVVTPPQLVELFGRLAAVGVPGAFDVQVRTDDRQADRYVAYLSQAGLGLPDETYYRQEPFNAVLPAYRNHIAAMLRLLGDDPAAATAAADRVVALETRIAAVHWDRVAVRDVVRGYTLLDADEFAVTAPALDLTAWLRGAGADEGLLPEIVVRQPSFAAGLSELLGDAELPSWRDWLRFHIVRSYAGYLSAPFVDEHFEFYGRTLTGSAELKPRWKRAVALTNQVLGEAVGKLYVERHFPPESKTRMEILVGNLIEAYRRDIESLDWMGPQTRQRALDKLGQLRTKIGYPTRWRDYSTIEIRPDDLVGNVMRARAFESARELGKLGQPVDPDEWFMTPQTVNAYYSPGTHEICFPAAILRPPFFHPDADDAYNYGGIGAVIGHEIGHAFDDQGSRYDGAGNLADWWTDDDRARFQLRADRLIAQYDQFEPRDQPGFRVNGGLTVGENIGDLGGLQIGLQAYLISRDGSVPPVIAGLTGVQRVFTSWALCWRLKARAELGAQLLAVDPHAPAEFRANVARNLDEFHEAYRTEPGDGMWLDPPDRVRIW